MKLIRGILSVSLKGVSSQEVKKSKVLIFTH